MRIIKLILDNKDFERFKYLKERAIKRYNKKISWEEFFLRGYNEKR